MSNDLKVDAPCPFCGGKGAPVEHKQGDWSVICLDCGAEGARHCDVFGAIGRWITRGTTSNTQKAAAAVLAAQEAKGLSKYGTTLDDAGLTLLEKMEHFQQEAADALMYATSVVEGLKEEAKQ